MQAVTGLICEDSAFGKRAPERLWELVATRAWRLNQEGVYGKVRTMKGIGRAVHSVVEAAASSR